MLSKRLLWVLGWAAIAAQTGFGVVGMIAIGLFAGFTLDLDCATGPLFTLVMLAVSIPISMYVAVWLLLRAGRAIRRGNEA